MKKKQEKRIQSIENLKKVFSTSNKLIYKPNQIDKIITKYIDRQEYRTKKSYYKDIIISFDIETSSFYKNDNKVAIMYEWTLAIECDIIIGRTWEEFQYVYNKIVNYFNTDNEHKIIIWVHNLSFEFQFFRKRLDWFKIFATSKRKVIQAITLDGIEFRCTLILSGYSLNNLAKQLKKYKINKLVGDLDYSLIRTHKTKLSKKELDYCINDALIIIAYIGETIERDGNISKIPLTKTSYVRNYCRRKCLRDNDNKFKDKFKKYHKLMKELSLDAETYNQLKCAFAGGYTHANAKYSRKVIENVFSADETSAYPYVMVSEKFPMSSPIRVIIKSSKEMSNYLDNYCCLFDVSFDYISATISYDNYISKSHCRNIEEPIENNGRLVSAKHIELTVTELDYFIIQKTYCYEKCKVSHFRIFKKDYLPTDYVKAILELYYKKTTLKGVEGKEEEYMRSKEDANSSYGMMVTDICKDDILYEDDMWGIEKANINDRIKKYNKSWKRFLYYPWGVWVTAYARFNLWTAIMNLKEDYIYSDTDSTKGINYDKHKDYFDKYNKYVLIKLKKAMEYHGIDIELTRPKNIYGEEKQIGVWDFEGTYDKFKTLGAKRYLVEKNNKLSITMSGVRKSDAEKYLLDTYGDKVFEAFDDQLIIPKDSTGKLIHTYLDDEYGGTIIDYQGNNATYYELSGTYLEPAEYSLSLSDQYIEYMLGIEQEN